MRLGGVLSGLEGLGVILRSYDQDLAVTANGTFLFPRPLKKGEPYSVIVHVQPTSPWQTCTVLEGTGIAGSTDVSVEVVCATNRMTVGGDVSGLMGSGLVLENRQTDILEIASNGAFTFAESVESGEEYAVTVVEQPMDPTQRCTLSNGSGVVENSDVLDVSVICVTSAFAVRASVVGLAGAGLVLANNGTDFLTVSSAGILTFPQAVPSGEPYDVTITGQPILPTQECSVVHGSGIITSQDVQVDVECETSTFLVKGTVSGLTGTGLVLRNNDTEDLAVTSSGTFSFTQPIASGDEYDVSVLVQPVSPQQNCSVIEGTGVVTSADITSVVVECTNVEHSLGGTITGLESGESVVLRDQTAGEVTVSANGPFIFPAKVPGGSAYDVTIARKPEYPIPQECTIDGGNGLAESDVDDILVTCTDTAVCGTWFVEETALRGLPTTTRGKGAVWLDVERDGDQDLFVRAVGLFINDGSGYFTEESAAHGLTHLGTDMVYPTSVGDFDSDGDLDLFVGDDTRFGTFNNHLYQNDGTGWFTDIASAAGVVLGNNTPRTAVFVDHDADGDLDLLYANEFGTPAMFRNDGALPFGNDSSLFDQFLQGDAAAWADYDNDGNQDLFLATGSWNRLNVLFRESDGIWNDVAGPSGIAGPNTSQRWGGATWADIDGDGWLDLHLVVAGGSANDFVYLNNGDGSFTESSGPAVGLPNALAFGTSAAWADFDRDGDLDALIPRHGLYVNDGWGAFMKKSDPIAPGGMGAWADFDADGDLDLFVSGGAAHTDRLYRATSAQVGCSQPRSLRVRVVTDPDRDATDANSDDDREAIGARIEIDLDGDGVFLEWPSATYLVGSAQSGNHAQSEIDPLIGTQLRSHANLRVTFGDGSVVVLTDIPANGEIIVRDPP